MKTTNIINKFTLRGLHGYKNIELDCSSKASIFISENGAGKTTILNSLYWILNNKISNLYKINFKTIELELGNKEKIIIDRKKLFGDANETREILFKDKNFIDLKNYCKPEKLINLIRKFSIVSESKVEQDECYKDIYKNSPYSGYDIIEKIKTLNAKVLNNTETKELTEKLTKICKEINLIYLPTYRRIETEFEDMKFSRINKDEFGFNIDELDEENIDDNSYKLINFGLSDVELKLKSMSNSIQSSIFKDYSELSAKMLDLILGMSSSNLQKKPPADLDKINLLLSRLGKESITQDTLSKSIVESKDSEESKLLSFFLNELLNSQNKHAAQEASIENFIKIINSYLTISSEEKFLKFDKAKFSVSVYNNIINENIHWNSLSSGEKQVVSIFSKLLLEEQKENLIIIDEPELSLSIEWQRKFLPDMIETDACKQLIAITHSPFIFDNDLDQFAKPIKVDIEK